MSSSMLSSAACARLVPAAQVFATPRQATAHRSIESEAIEYARRLRQPVQYALLYEAHEPIGEEAEKADKRNGEENQGRIERVARHHDHLSEAVSHSSRFRDQHYHPRSKQVEAQHHEQSGQDRRDDDAEVNL